ncbi:MAG TPA: NBR1-Ig-like domain-containing protein [Anaerolineales bacterium]|nr:NBR1-Ig-like domain-containing protein [Anaerolineales bacterium]
MKTKAIIRIAKVNVIGLIVLMTACSPLITIQPITEAPSPTSMPTILSSPTLEPTAIPTLQPTAVPTDLPTATVVPVITGCQDSAQYISDDGLDGTTYAPNTPFTKTWRLKNTGSCTWDSRYLVYQISGAFMTQSPGYLILPQGQTVAPGQTVDISVGMTSPVENGSYRADWGLKKPNGQLMPIQGGANGNSFYVKLKVSNANVKTTASIDMELEQGSGTVCTADSTYFVNTYITADGATTVSYEIGSTAGQILAGYFQDGYNTELIPIVYGNLVFAQADTQALHYRFVGPYPYPDDISVYIRVNGGEFYTTKLSCQ